jgi:hypothetical protein
MEGTHLPLNVWYRAMYLILASSKGISAGSSKGISALNLSKQLDLQYRTTWHLAHRIRTMLGSGDQTPLDGLVDADEINNRQQAHPISRARLTRSCLT